MTPTEHSQSSSGPFCCSRQSVPQAPAEELSLSPQSPPMTNEQLLRELTDRLSTANEELFHKVEASKIEDIKGGWDSSLVLSNISLLHRTSRAHQVVAEALSNNMKIIHDLFSDLTQTLSPDNKALFYKFFNDMRIQQLEGKISDITDKLNCVVQRIQDQSDTEASLQERVDELTEKGQRLLKERVPLKKRLKELDLEIKDLKLENFGVSSLAAAISVRIIDHREKEAFLKKRLEAVTLKLGGQRDVERDQLERESQSLKDKLECLGARIKNKNDESNNCKRRLNELDLQIPRLVLGRVLLEGELEERNLAIEDQKNETVSVKIGLGNIALRTKIQKEKQESLLERLDKVTLRLAVQRKVSF